MCRYPSTIIRQKDKKRFWVNCGKCDECLRARRLSLAYRMIQDASRPGVDCYMLTLTYDDEHIPEDNKVNKKDCQLFFKRLRKYGLKFSYLLCSEYGEKKGRSHYHAIILFRNYEGTLNNLHDKIELAWKNGFIVLEPCGARGINYVMKYMHKQNNFQLISKKPFIGHSIINDKRIVQQYLNDYTFSIDGVYYPVYKLLKNKIEHANLTDEERIIFSLHKEKYYEKLLDDKVKNKFNNDWALYYREQAKKAMDIYIINKSYEKQKT